LDEYSKSGPKTPKAASRERDRERTAQMRDLLAIRDEETLVLVLRSRYNLTPKDPRYLAIMQIWNDAQRRLQQER
jgi:hypothetical protein